MFELKPFPEFRDLVTFIPNFREPIHNWYWYKEGFSKGLVDYFIKKFQLQKGQTVLDPFCGSGTTLLACKQSNINSIGFDTSPLCTFTSRVKTENYDLVELKNIIDEVLKWKPVIQEHLPRDKYLRKAFSRYALGDTIFYRSKLAEINDKKARDFLYLALIDSSIKASYIFKDGSVVKIMKTNRPPLKILFRNKIKRMYKDLVRTGLPEAEAKVQQADARKLPLENETVDAVITSPPYLNKIEYTNIYKLEYSLFFDLPPAKLKSFIGDETEGCEEFKDMPLIAQSYFKDMKQVMSELFRVCGPSAKLAVAIGGGCFPDQAIIVDEILAKITEDAGFKVNEIKIAREGWCTARKTEKIGKIRESVILLEK